MTYPSSFLKRVTKLYARLGYSLEEATGLADSAILYQNVGDNVENIDEATSSLISTMQGLNGRS